MASLNLAPDELKLLDSTRMRLQQLLGSIEVLLGDIYRAKPLPHPSSLKTYSKLLKDNLDAILKILQDNHVLFQSVVVHPSTNYPGRTQENILLSLVRKKLEPEVENWAEKARDAAVAAATNGENDANGNAQTTSGLESERLQALTAHWENVEVLYKEAMFHYLTEEGKNSYTREERSRGIENVRTGLRRKLDEESSEEEEDDDEDEEEEDAAGQPTASRVNSVVDLTGGSGPPTGIPPTPQGAGAPSVREPDFGLWYAMRADFNIPRTVELSSQLAEKTKPGMVGGPLASRGPPRAPNRPGF